MQDKFCIEFDILFVIDLWSPFVNMFKLKKLYGKALWMEIQILGKWIAFQGQLGRSRNSLVVSWWTSSLWKHSKFYWKWSTDRRSSLIWHFPFKSFSSFEYCEMKWWTFQTLRFFSDDENVCTFKNNSSLSTCYTMEHETVLIVSLSNVESWQIPKPHSINDKIIQNG